MDTDALKAHLPAILQQVPGVRMLYLFGSRAAGREGPNSDYDVAVLADPAVDGPTLRSELAHELTKALGTECIDVLILNRAPVELAYAVVATGRRLYEADLATRVEYEAGVGSRYADYLPVLRAQRASILQGDGNGRRAQRYRAALGRTRRTLGQIAAASGKAAP